MNGNNLMVGGISIHALTRSATGSVKNTGETYAISIHALTRSATYGVPSGGFGVVTFQSTHSRGVRR